jgi:hypothetical protein
VLVIIGLAGALTVPQLAGSLTTIRTKTEAAKVASALRYARSRAVARKAVYVSEVDFRANTLKIGKYRDLPGREAIFEDTSPEDEGVRIFEPAEGVYLEKSKKGAAEKGDHLYQIAFFPGGGASGGEIAVTDGKNRRYYVNVDMITGSVHVLQ